MPGKGWPRALEEAFELETQRQVRVVVALVAKWPEHRHHIACVLGMAVAYADSFGIDAEAFIAGLRKVGGRADELVPPGREPEPS